VTPRAVIARLALPLLALGLTGCASGGHRTAAAGASSGASSTAAAITSASATPADSDAGQFADPNPSSDTLTGAAKGCALVAEMVQQIRDNHLPEAEAKLPELVAVAYGLRDEPASAALVQDVREALAKLADPSVLEHDWAQYHDVSRLPVVPKLVADCHQ